MSTRHSLALAGDRNGKQVATIKRVDSRKFFNSHKFVTVSIDEAIKQKELLAIN